MFRFLPFLIIGGTAFVFTLAAYRTLTFVGLSPFLAQPLALWLSMTGTWIANRKLTFNIAARPSFMEYGRYLLASWLGAGVNYAGFALLVLAGANDLFALAVATMLATVLNFLSYDRFVFISPSADKREGRQAEASPHSSAVIPKR